MGLRTEPPQCYSTEGFYNLLANYGPLWVSKVFTAAAGGGHAVVVTGMYFDGDQAYVRIADPWDRPVGTPGAPGTPGGTHSTGSRYIMRYEDFQTEYEMRMVGDPPTPQILHSPNIGDHVPNTRTDRAPEGYAMAVAPRVGTPPPPKRSRAMDAGAIASIAGTVITLLSGKTGDISWSLPQWAGVKHPADREPSGAQADYHDAVIELDQWPVVGGTFGADDIYAWFRIRWQYNGTSLGRVYVEPRGTDDAMGWGLTVTGTIEDDARLYPRDAHASVPGAAQVPALHLVMHYVFDETIADDQVAVTRVTLYADGTHDIASEWIQHSRLGGGTPTNVARTN
jgi:hypothetical protein